MEVIKKKEVEILGLQSITTGKPAGEKAAPKEREDGLRQEENTGKRHIY